jgi:hypothetical protein
MSKPPSKTIPLRGAAPVLGALGLAVLLPGVILYAATQEDVFRVLRARGIPFDEETAQARAAEAALATVDPLGRIVPVEQAESLLGGRTILQAETWEEGICYLRLGGLFDGSATAIVERARAWAGGGRSGLILDVRGAAGNSFEALETVACAVAPWRRGRGGDGPGEPWRLRRASAEETSLHTIGAGAPPADPPLTDSLPVMLLVDEATSGASELLAATMKDRRGVMVVGRPTRGDATLREAVPLTDGEVMYVSTAWLVPSEGSGTTNAFDRVEPDVEVSPAYTNRPAGPAPARPSAKGLSKKAAVDRELMARVSGDAVLLRAVDILLGLKALHLYGTPENGTNPPRK